MGDISESYYGKGLYGKGLYGLKPIWLFGGEANIPFYVYSNLRRYRIVSFTATATISFDVRSYLGLPRDFEGVATIPLNIFSAGYLGKFWLPDEPGSPDWIPQPQPDPVWAGTGNGVGPWVPVGPDLRPNDA